MSEDRFVYVVFIESTPEKVWRSLTEGAFTRRYWAGRRIESDWTVGALAHLYVDDTEEVELSGEVLECDPPRRLSYTWRCKDGDRLSEQASAVSFVIDPFGGSVRLTATHEPLAANDPARQGWPAILSSLKSYLETGNPVSATEAWRRRGAA